jgi:hypothetical protein
MAQFIQFFNHWPTSRWIAFHFSIHKKWNAFPFYTILNGNAIHKKEEEVVDLMPMNILKIDLTK